MNKNISAFVARRTEALAQVFLTRRPDITVVPFDHGHLDVFASIAPKTDDPAQGLVGFGAIVWGTDQPLPTATAADQFANAKWKAKSRETKDQTIYYFPVVLTLFSMVNDDGYFAWVTEPSSRSGAAEPALTHVDRFAFEKLDKRALDRIVARVKSWYASLATELLVAR